MKYRVTGKVNGYRYKGKSYPSGSTVELPDGAYVPSFLEKVVEAPVVLAAEPRVEITLSAPVDGGPRAELSASLEDLETPPEVKPKPRRERK